MTTPMNRRDFLRRSAALAAAAALPALPAPKPPATLLGRPVVVDPDFRGKDYRLEFEAEERPGGVIFFTSFEHLNRCSAATF